MCIRSIRLEKGFSASNMAAVINKSVKTYYKKERGEVRFFPEEMQILSDYTGVSINQLFFDNELSNIEQI